MPLSLFILADPGAAMMDLEKTHEFQDGSTKIAFYYARSKMTAPRGTGRRSDR